MTETGEARALERAARFIFAEADTEWYAEQIAHSISGDAVRSDWVSRSW